MIIDVRCRFTTGTAAAYFKSRQGSAPTPDDIDGFLAVLDHAGVDVAVSPLGNSQGMKLGFRELPPRVSSNSEQMAHQALYPQRVVGVAGIDVGNVAHDALTELARCVEGGLKVATIEPGRSPLFVDHPADRRLYPFYALAQDLGVTVILQTSGLLGGKNIDYAHPKWIDRIAEDFPDLRIICAHGCYPYVREIIAVAVRRRNVFVAPDMYLFWPGRDDWIHAVNHGVLADRFLFASAYPLSGSLREFVNRFMRLGWKPKVLDRIMYRNAIQALGLTEHPVFGPIHAGADRLGRYSRTRFLLRSRLGLLKRSSGHSEAASRDSGLPGEGHT
jgi:uncharacterized protein